MTRSILKNPEVTLEEVFENIAHRDYQDTTREESPLVRAADAIILDNTNLTPDEQLQFALDKVEKLESLKVKFKVAISARGRCFFGC
jgi:cytidylate kinase